MVGRGSGRGPATADDAIRGFLPIQTSTDPCGRELPLAVRHLCTSGLSFGISRLRFKDDVCVHAGRGECTRVCLTLHVAQLRDKAAPFMAFDKLLRLRAAQQPCQSYRFHARFFFSFDPSNPCITRYKKNLSEMHSRRVLAEN